MAEWESSTKALTVLTDQGGYLGFGSMKNYDSNPNHGKLIVTVGDSVRFVSPKRLDFYYDNEYIRINSKTYPYNPIRPYKPYPLVQYGDMKIGIYLERDEGEGMDNTRISIVAYYDTDTGFVVVANNASSINNYGNIDEKYCYMVPMFHYNSNNELQFLYLGRFTYNAERDETVLYKLALYENVQPSELIYWKHLNGIGLVNKEGTIITDISTLPTIPQSSTTGGGGGSFNIHSDPIGIPLLPSLSAMSSGLLTIYAPTLAQIQALGGYLWSDDILDELAKMWADPLELIVSLSIIPLAVQRVGERNVKLGALSSGVSMSTVPSQYVQLDCGTINLQEFYGSALDYSPYTKVSIYLPFVGTVPLNVDDVMGATLQVAYNIDLLSGACVCVVKVTRPNLESVIYHYSGNCITMIPVTMSSHAEFYKSVINLASTVASTSISSGMALASGAKSMAQQNLSIASSVTNGISSGASEVLGAKETARRSGGVSGATGILDNMKPYLIVERPIQSLASNYNKYVGYPSNITYLLDGLTGFTQIESVVSNTLTCSEAEQIEIIKLLQEGVYL